MKLMGKTLPLALLVSGVVALGAAPAGAGKQVERPYKAAEVGEVVVEAIEDCNFSEVEIVCENSTTSTGIVSHLGKVTTTSMGLSAIDLVAPPCVLADGSDGIVVHNTGTGVFVAANGDELYLAFENTGCADLTGSGAEGALNGTQTITGGTGRFAGASGHTISSGTGAGDTFVLNAVGTITY